MPGRDGARYRESARFVAESSTTVRSGVESGWRDQPGRTVAITPSESGGRGSTTSGDLGRDIPRDRLVVLTGRERFGQEFPRLRHPPRRGPEAVHRGALDLRPPVPRPARTPRRRRRSRGYPRRSPSTRTREARAPGARSGPSTEILDYLRLLYARAGLPHCPSCGQAIRRQTPEQMVDGVMALGEGRKVVVLAPLVRGRKGAARRRLRRDPPRRAPAGPGRWGSGRNRATIRRSWRRRGCIRSRRWSIDW